jgi:hypothetical protein
MTYVNIDRYTSEQVGPAYKTFAAAQSARKGFRCVTMGLSAKGLVELL